MNRMLVTLFRAEPGGAALSVLASLASGAGAAIMAIVISRALEADSRSAVLAVAFFAAAAMHFTLRVFSEVWLIRLTQRVLLGMRLALARRLLATPQIRLQQIGRQPLLTILTRDMDTFVNAVQLVPLLIGNLLLVFGCFAYLAWVDWQICVAVFACLLIGAGLFKLAERRPIARIFRLREEIDQLYTRQRALIEGAKELQLNGPRGAHYIDRVIGPAAARVAREYAGAMSSYIWVVNIGNSLFYLVIGVVLFLMPGVTMRDMLPAVLLMLYLVRPVSEVMISLPAIRQSVVALDRIEQLQAELDPAAALPPPLQLQDRIVLCGVTHSYMTEAEDGVFTLGPIDLVLRRGEVVFAAGGNGSGKTTLAMLLCGLYRPESGKIEVDGLPVTEAMQASYRQIFSAVFSDFHLFEQLPGSDDPEMEAKARHFIALFRMSHKVTVRDGCLSTTSLSTGQRKRLALVSAYLEDRPVYLFDEWAADQDPVFKAVFYTELLPELKARGKAVFVITHDDAYFGCADRVVKLVDGRIVQPEQEAA
ncbi:MAG: cyclic peptide export ABC transporter [Rhodobacteraceae bacterium]|jgi:putative ATP-binding cassette transporter|nr:cyclic peptide export ABC transporter [Paracoccaceae bacterium]